MNGDYSATTLAGCRMCSGCLIGLLAIAVTVSTIIASSATPPYESTSCGFLYDTYVFGRNTSTPMPVPGPMQGVPANTTYPTYSTPYVSASPSVVQIFWYAVPVLFWDAIWLLFVTGYWYWYGPMNGGLTAVLASDNNRMRWYQWFVSMPFYFVILAFVTGVVDTYAHWLVAALAIALVAQLAANEAWVASKMRLGTVNRGQYVPNEWGFVVVALVIVGVLAYVNFSAASYAVASTLTAGTRLTSMIWISSIAAYALLVLVLMLVAIIGHSFFGLWSPLQKEIAHELFYFLFVMAVVAVPYFYSFGQCTAIVA